MDKFYSIVQSRRAYTDALFTDCAGKRVLEYGCGPGSAAFKLAECGAEVVGIDISEVAIEQARAIAARKPGAAHMSFEVMNAEALEFPGAHFDLICGTGILHHLDLRKSMSELSRVLKGDGKAIFVEPLGHNPFINLYRRLTPRLRTEDEHPLLSHDLQMVKDYFGKVEVHAFHLFSLCAVPFRSLKKFDSLLNGFEAVDQALFNCRFSANRRGKSFSNFQGRERLKPDERLDWKTLYAIR